MPENRTLWNGSIHLFNGDALELYDSWETPTVIVSDGPYGVNGFPGDLVAPDGLDKWYEPHIKRWSELSTPLTTLWFWNTEVGWATVHPILEKYGWTYVSCCIWDKGMSHVAGNTNTKTIRHLPVVTGGDEDEEEEFCHIAGCGAAAVPAAGNGAGSEGGNRPQHMFFL